MAPWITPALLLVVVASGCVADQDAAQKIAPSPAADRPPLVTEWERQPVPRTFRTAASTFDRVDGLLFSLADHLVDLPSEEDGALSVTVRARDDDGTVVGGIVVDGYLDDSVRGHEFRASLGRDGGVWHVEKLLRRQLCRRGGGAEACL